MGVECKKQGANFAKNDGADPRTLVRELRDRGIGVLASGILCMEHHTQENIQEDIDHLVGLGSDFVQFMLLTPLPVTQLYRDIRSQGLLREELPFEEWHGQKLLNWRHPHFPGDSAEQWVRKAFRQDYEVNGSSMGRVAETAFRGYRRLHDMANRDACLEMRHRQAAIRAREWSTMLPELARHGVNVAERRRAAGLAARVREAMGRPTLRLRAMQWAIAVCAATWRLRVRLLGDGIQPSTIVTRYPAAVVAPAAAGQSAGRHRRPAIRAPRRGVTAGV
jgi:hypothetical protein